MYCSRMVMGRAGFRSTHWRWCWGGFEGGGGVLGPGIVGALLAVGQTMAFLNSALRVLLATDPRGRGEPTPLSPKAGPDRQGRC